MAVDGRRLTLGIALSVAAGLAILESVTEGYWGDELWTVRFATRPMLDMLVAAATDAHPPLYYVLLNAWVTLWGVGPLTLRLPSIVFGVTTIGLLYILAADLYDRETGAVAALLSALSIPLLIYLAEARMYTQLTAFTVGSYLTFWRLLIREGGWGKWVLYILSSLGMLYSHGYGAVFLGGQILTGLLLLIVPTALPGNVQRTWQTWGGALAILGVSAVPWLLWSAHTVQSVSEPGYPYVEWIAEANAGYLHLFEWLARPYPVALLGTLCLLSVLRINGRSSSAPSRLPVSIRLQERPQALFLGGWYGGSLALAAAASMLIRPLFYYRFCLPLLAPVLILAARGTMQFNFRALSGAILGTLLVFGAMGAGQLVTTTGKPPIDEAMDHIATNGSEDDLVYIESWGRAVYLLYREPGTPAYTENIVGTARDPDDIWVLMRWTQTIHERRPTWDVTWWKFTSSGPYRSYYDGDDRVWWVGRVDTSEDERDSSSDRLARARRIVLTSNRSDVASGSLSHLSQPRLTEMHMESEAAQPTFNR